MAQFNDLTDIEKALYYKLKQALITHQKEFIYDYKPIEISNVLKVILIDSPGIFWFEGKWSYQVDKIVFTYIYLKEEKEQKVIELNEILESFDFLKQDDEYTIMQVVSDFIVTNVSYGFNVCSRGQNAYDALIYRKAVCKGIAKAYQLILHHLGVCCTLMEGSLDGIHLHVWNRVSINNEHYQVDVTMGYENKKMITKEERLMDTMLYPNIPKQFKKLGDIHYIGAGSNGKVYKISPSKEYALKVIEANPNTTKYRNALSEIKMLETLKGCRHIVQIYDHFIEKNNVCILQEYLTPLDLYIKIHPFEVQHIIQIGIDLCEALIECKNNNILHCDIQPNNIFFDYDGVLKIADFSSAIDVEDVDVNTCIRGTLNFMAPELLRDKKCDESTDIYSVGLFLFWLLNECQLPFDTNNQAIALATRMVGVPIPTEIISNVNLKQIISKACAYDKNNRYTNFMQVRNALQQIDSDVQNNTELDVEISDTQDTVQLQNNWMTYDSDPFASSCCIEPSSTITTTPQLSDVQFSAIAPKTFVSGEYTMIDIVMYEEEFRYIADKLMEEVEVEMKEVLSGMFEVSKGATIKICITSPHLEIEDNIEEGQWIKNYLEFNFPIFVPEDYNRTQILFMASVYIEDVILTKLKFTVKCSSDEKQEIKIERNDIQSAFVSYASQDRNQVARVIQGIRKVRPEMDIFFDVEALRSGDNWEKVLYKEIEERDILYLCWSSCASKSKWVDAEWRYAMDKKGLEAIEPIPLENQNDCPPPNELGGKHFNDRLLYIIK